MIWIFFAASACAWFLIGFELGRSKSVAGWPTDLDFVLVIGGMVCFGGVAIRTFNVIG